MLLLAVIHVHVHVHVDALKLLASGDDDALSTGMTGHQI